MVAHLTPDQGVACSIHVGFKSTPPGSGTMSSFLGECSGLCRAHRPIGKEEVDNVCCIWLVSIYAGEFYIMPGCANLQHLLLMGQPCSL